MDLSRLVAALEKTDPVRVEGRVRALIGLSVRAAIPGVRSGEMVEIVRREPWGPLAAEVVG